MAVGVVGGGGAEPEVGRSVEDDGVAPIEGWRVTGAPGVEAGGPADPHPASSTTSRVAPAAPADSALPRSITSAEPGGG